MITANVAIREGANKPTELTVIQIGATLQVLCRETPACDVDGLSGLLESFADLLDPLLEITLEPTIYRFVVNAINS